MQISDLLYHKTTHEIIFPPDPDDPSYFETGEICGVIFRKKGAKGLERLNEDWL